MGKQANGIKMQIFQRKKAFFLGSTEISLEECQKLMFPDGAAQLYNNYIHVLWMK